MGHRFGKQIFLFLLSICVCAISWFFVHKIHKPWADAKGARDGRLKVQLWDLYPRWVGARNLFLHGQSPYSIETTHEIQMAFYGRYITPQDFTRPPAHGRYEDEQRFAYPIYVVFLMAPTIYLNFQQIEFWAPVALGVIAAATVVFAAFLMDWDLPPLVLLSLILFVLSTPQIEHAMEHQQLSIVVAFALAAAGWCVHRGPVATAGFLVALSTIKPQMAMLPFAWFVIWASGEWPRRWRFLGGFAGAMAVFTGVGELLAPGWIGDFIAGLEAYRHYYPTTSVLRVALGDTAGISVGILLVVGTLILGWRNRGVSGNSRAFVTILAFFLMAAVLAFPIMTIYNHCLLILPALLVLQDWRTLTKASRIIFSALISWYWITGLLLLVIPLPINIKNVLVLLPSLPAVVLPFVLPVLLWRTLRTELSDGRYASAVC